LGSFYDKVRENVFYSQGKVWLMIQLSNAIADSRLGSQVKRLFSVFSDSYLEFTKVYNGKHNLAARLGFKIPE
jgi:hypothetical protein